MNGPRTRNPNVALALLIEPSSGDLSAVAQRALVERWATDQRVRVDVWLVVGDEGALTALGAAEKVDAGVLAVANPEALGLRTSFLEFNLQKRGMRVVCANGEDTARQAALRASSQRCPVCSEKVIEDSRYPRSLCEPCASQAVDETGRALSFWNHGMGGGFRATYTDDGSPSRGHVCFVQGVKCWADEAYMGGVVLVPYEHRSKG